MLHHSLVNGGSSLNRQRRSHKSHRKLAGPKRGALRRHGRKGPPCQTLVACEQITNGRIAFVCSVLLDNEIGYCEMQMIDAAKDTGLKGLLVVSPLLNAAAVAAVRGQ